MSAQDGERFDPRAVLGAFGGELAVGVVIGGLARVLRGSDEVTTGVDYCPAVQAANIPRLQKALARIGAERRDGRALVVDPAALAAEPVIELASRFGEVKLVATPAGVPRGFEALRAGASNENLGDAVQPFVASTADLLTMSSALGREQDLRRLPVLRRILALEADPAALIGVQEPVDPRYTATRPRDDLGRPSGPRLGH